MNPIELNTLRRSLWLTREQACKLNRMTERSWRYLEDGTRAIPQDVQDAMRQLDAIVNNMADNAWDEYLHRTVMCGLDWSDIEAVLLRYASTADLAAAHPDMTGLPVDIHGAAIDRARILLEDEGTTVRIVLFDPAAYREWIAGNSMADNPASRAAWAATVVDPAPKVCSRQPSGEDSAG